MNPQVFPIIFGSPDSSTLQRISPSFWPNFQRHSRTWMALEQSGVVFL